MAQWTGRWLGFAYDPREDLGVFAFRNTVRLDQVPAKLPIRISADNRYKLYVNGKMVSFGPQRGDANHWHYDPVDIAPFLIAGDNHLIALVWSFGWMAPMAQHTVRTGFVFDVPSAGHEGLNTPGTWEVARVEGWSFEMMHSEIQGFYIDIGPGEIIAPGLLPDAKHPALANLKWRKPHVISQAEDRGTLGGGTPWMLVERPLPPMRYELRSARPKIRRGFIGDDPSPNLTLLTHKDVLDGPVSLVPGSKLLLDYGELLCSYPLLVLSGPAGASVLVTYSEAMWQTDGSKGNRDQVEGKKMRGYQDKFVLDAEPTAYEPLWWRTYRYLMIEIAPRSSLTNQSELSTNSDQVERRVSTPQPPSSLTNQSEEGGVTVHSVDAIETGYPYKVESSFVADDPSVAKLWEVSVRTAERCAGETYFDCPYYEQLQYAGDTRIQTLIGYYAGRDRRLQRNAVENLGWSLMENGITQSRYPSRQTQVIPPFSLWWVMMLYDQMLYDGDDGRPDFISAQTLARVLGRYRQLVKQENQFWQFGDWVPAWGWGVPPGGAGSAMHQLTLMHASAAAASVEAHMDGKSHIPVKIEPWKDFDAGLASSGAGLLTSNKSHVDCTPSEHAEALFRLLPEFRVEHPEREFSEVSPWPAEALAKAKAAKCTYYFSYYKHLAMFGREDSPYDYLQELKPWKEMIENGLTTFAENPEPVRSDCHAWSAHPLLGFFQIVAGVTSTAPGWKQARIAPKPGSLKRFDARIAHPAGELRVAYEGEKLSIDTPVPAELVWKKKKQRLEPGKHEF